MDSREDIRERIRCYDDAEIPAAMEFLVKCDSMKRMMNFIHPALSDPQWRSMMLDTTSLDGFQEICFLPGARRIAECSATEVTCEGLGHLSPDKGRLFISNHRDIAVDAGMLQLVLHDNGHPTTEVAFGENLIFNDFFVRLCKSNKLFSVPRMSDMGRYVRYAPVIADYVRTKVAAGTSVWIAQRNGRTKDGNDLTEPALLKLFLLGCRETQAEALAALNITPIAVSYEYEPCDVQKVGELFVKRRDGFYKKRPDEDFESVMTGLLQPKGAMHYTFCRPVSRQDIDSVCRDGRVLFADLARLIDRRIHAGYHCFPSNHIAYDLLTGRETSKNVCDTEYRTRFEDYLAGKLDELVGRFGEENRAELTRLFLELYAGPLKNKLLADS